MQQHHIFLVELHENAVVGIFLPAVERFERYLLAGVAANASHLTLIEPQNAFVDERLYGRGAAERGIEQFVARHIGRFLPAGVAFERVPVREGEECNESLLLLRRAVQ